MSGPFVSEEKFPIVIKYVERSLRSGLKNIKIVKDKEAEEKYKGLIKEINTQWIQPNWKQSNDLVRTCTKFDAQAGERILDWQTYRMRLLESYMTNWDIAEDGASGPQLVPCTADYMSKLNPQIAAALVDEFLSKTTMTDDEMGN